MPDLVVLVVLKARRGLDGMLEVVGVRRLEGGGLREIEGGMEGEGEE